jgi:predicted nucleic acid-binding protein
MIKRGRVSLEQALEAIRIYRQIPIRFTEVELDNSLEIGSDHGIYAYDAYLLRCATKYNSALITLDRKLMQVAYEMNIEVIEVA